MYVHRRFINFNWADKFLLAAGKTKPIEEQADLVKKINIFELCVCVKMKQILITKKVASIISLVAQCCNRGSTHFYWKQILFYSPNNKQTANFIFVKSSGCFLAILLSGGGQGGSVAAIRNYVSLFFFLICTNKIQIPP